MVSVGEKTSSITRLMKQQPSAATDWREGKEDHRETTHKLPELTHNLFGCGIGAGEVNDVKKVMGM